MSRYKFRAWDKNKKWMVYDVQNAYDGMWSERNSDEINDHYDYVSNFKSFMDEEEFNFMQYTGLKDKNGVEIYEGDIVQIKDHSFQRKPDGYTGIEIDGFYPVTYTERMELVVGQWLLMHQLPYVTVIGNIYKNPELLECEME